MNSVLLGSYWQPQEVIKYLIKPTNDAIGFSSSGIMGTADWQRHFFWLNKKSLFTNTN